MPHETAATVSLNAQPHMLGACVFSCNMPPALLAEWPGSFTCYCGDTGVEQAPKLTVSTKS